MDPEVLNGRLGEGQRILLTFSLQVEKGSWSGEMSPLTVEVQTLGQWEVQIQTNTPLTFIKVKGKHNQSLWLHSFSHILIIIQT